jgi:esterase/lipase superfamily enzyme
MYWIVTNRNVDSNNKTFGDEFTNLSFWQNSSEHVDNFAGWVPVSQDAFRDGLVAIADTFPDPNSTPSEDQKHVSIFVHGFDTNWLSAVQRYGAIVSKLFTDPKLPTDPKSLGACILFTWPSKGSVAGYLPDRSEARQSGDDFANVLGSLYDWMSMKQIHAINAPANGCKAQTSVIAHSMGNYVVENAMNVVWTRKNRPLLVSLINQLVMVAADVDNDLFRAGDNVEHGDGEGIANLCYRITAMYSGKDSVLGASAGLKHFGKRRLGRSGLDRTCPIPDNVWDIDCSNLFGNKVSGLEVHSAYFNQQNCYDLMRQLLRGIDRSVLVGTGGAPAALPKTQST